MLKFQKEIYREPEYLEITINKLEDFEGFQFESSSGLTEEFAEFAKMFKTRMKEECAGNGLTLIDCGRGHFYCSGFIQNNQTGRMAYFSISDVRHFPGGWFNNILIRTAEHAKDYTGGRNQYTDLANIGKSLAKITSPRPAQYTDKTEQGGGR
jgi:hypothetical protein